MCLLLLALGEFEGETGYISIKPLTILYIYFWLKGRSEHNYYRMSSYIS